MEVKVLPEGVNDHDDTGDTVLQSQRVPHELDQALMSDPAQLLEQVAVEAEVGSQHFGDGEREMAVRDRIEDGPAQ